MNIRSTWMPTAVRVASVVTLAASIAVAACSHDQLLGVETPDIIDVGVANSPAGAQTFRVAAIGNFWRFIGGDVGGGSPLGLNLTGGMLGDEIFSARAGTEPMDNRNINPNSFPIDTWTQVGNTYTRLVRAVNLVVKYPPTSGANDQLAELHAMEGFVFTIVAEDYCNGVPFWDGVDGVDLKTVTLSTTDMYARAKAQFDSALSLAAAGSNTQYFALVGKARTLVDQNDYAGAAAITGPVPTSFVYHAQFSKLTTGLVNAIYDWMLSTRNFGASDKEGTNGLDYVTGRDARILVDPKTGRGQDGTPTPTLNHYPSTDAPVPVATGIEARLIEAEAQLKASNPAWLTTLNTLRTTPQKYGLVQTTATSLAPLVDPSPGQFSTPAQVDMLFRERAFWMYMTAHRLGDMRRLIRQYGRTQDKVFPTGSYFKGGSYGADITLVPSQTETNNPNWQACTDRNA
jgi:starch-binding outer membrane protein, SusD/RagB family